jgi:hypothetical protein
VVMYVLLELLKVNRPGRLSQLSPIIINQEGNHIHVYLICTQVELYKQEAQRTTH